MRRTNIRRDRRLAAVKVAVALILLTGISAQTVMQIKIAQQKRVAHDVQREITELSARINNLEHNIGQYHDLDRIGARAKELGMDTASSEQIRTVTVLGRGANTDGI